MTETERVKPAESLPRLLGRVERTLDAFAVVLAAAMMVQIAAEVTSRLLFRTSIDGSAEIVSHYYMVGVVFLPLMGSAMRGRLMAATLIDRWLSDRTIRGLEGLSNLVLSGWFAFLCWASSLEAMRSTAKHEFVETTVSLLTVWPSRWLLPIAFACAALWCLVAIWRRPPANNEVPE